MSPFPGDSDSPFVDEPLERVTRQIPHPEPRAEFVVALRARFLDVRSPHGVTQPGADAPVVLATTERRRAPRRLARWLVPIGMAAGLTVFFFTAFGERAQALHWRVVEPAPGAMLTIDGAPVHIEEAAARLLDGSHVVATSEWPVSLMIDGYLLLALEPHSELSISALTPALRDSFRLDAHAGTVSVYTGPAFRGSNLLLTTPDLLATATGTAFVANVEARGTCVCCIEGPVVIQAPESLSDSWTVDSGRMCRIYKDDEQAPKWGAVNEKHTQPLKALQRRAPKSWK